MSDACQSCVTGERRMPLHKREAAHAVPTRIRPSARGSNASCARYSSGPSQAWRDGRCARHKGSQDRDCLPIDLLYRRRGLRHVVHVHLITHPPSSTHQMWWCPCLQHGTWFAACHVPCESRGLASQPQQRRHARPLRRTSTSPAHSTREHLVGAARECVRLLVHSTLEHCAESPAQRDWRR